ncbi:MAG: flagellar biosynthesis protein FlhA [Pseudomonadota bacterium]
MRLGAPALLIAIMAMMVVPLPAFALDVLFTFNISLALVVLLACVYSRRPLDFAAFPTLLLVATLLRLSLNVASTRVVLLNGHNGTGAAGQVIEAFGDFVVGGNYAVGFVVFAILVIINFVVITKGAGRISEVSARFTLDAMPGKQMAIDADLNAGVLTQEEAKQRRAEVSEEADFYGAMDGASKFVKGDAIAGILILVINIVGGLVIGVLQHGMAVEEAARVFVLLTIGDGLVAQIPSLLLATAAAIIVTRVSAEAELGQQITSQLFDDPKSLTITGSVLFVMGVIPGMPNVAFLTMGGGALTVAYFLYRKQQAARDAQALEPPPPPMNSDSKELSWDDVSPADVIGLEVGYRLIPLVDRSQQGELLGRLRGVRKKLSQELGFLIPSVHIRDNLDLDPSTYRISVQGAIVGQAEVQPDKEMAIDPGQTYGQVEGTPARDPVFDLTAYWIAPSSHDQAQSLGYTVVDASTVVATHLSRILQEHAHLLLGHDEVQKLLDAMAKTSPKLVEDLVPNTLPMAVVVKVMQSLLEEQVPLRDVRTILQVLSEHGPKSQDPAALTALVRVALGRLIVQQINDLAAELPVITLAPSLEHLLHQSVETMNGNIPAIEPGLASTMITSLKSLEEQRDIAGEPTVLLVNDLIRDFVSRFVRQAARNVQVLGFNEIPSDTQLRIVGQLGDNAALEHTG